VLIFQTFALWLSLLALTGGGIPSAHMQGNGVAVGTLACYYSATPSALYCFNTATDAWSSMPCTVEHKGGAMAVVGSTVMVAGGFNTSTSQPTAVVDIFDLSGAM
jgi:hypothetical protein